MQSTLRQNIFPKMIAQGVAILCLLCIAGCVGSPPAASKPTPKPPPIEIKPASFDLPEDGVVIPIEIINNIPLIRLPAGDPQGDWYVVDTGTSGLVLSPAYAASRRLRRSGSVDFGAWGRWQEKPTAGIEKLSIGDAQFYSFDAVVMDLSGLDSGLKREITGVIGMGVFEGLRVTIDYASAELRLEQSGRTNDSKDKRTETDSVLWRQLDAALIAIPLEITGQELHFMLDTGLSSGLVMDPRTANRLGVERDPDRQVTTQTFHGLIRSDVGQLETPAWVGGVGVRNSEVLIRSHRPAVGGAFLKHFRVIIDMAAGQVELAPPATPSDRVLFREQ